MSVDAPSLEEERNARIAAAIGRLSAHDVEWADVLYLRPCRMTKREVLDQRTRELCAVAASRSSIGQIPELTIWSCLPA